MILYYNTYLSDPLEADHEVRCIPTSQPANQPTIRTDHKVRWEPAHQPADHKSQLRDRNLQCKIWPSKSIGTHISGPGQRTCSRLEIRRDGHFYVWPKRFFFQKNTRKLLKDRYLFGYFFVSRPWPEHGVH